VFILDISGVAVVDTAVANYLIKITKATRLMGCTCLISGISGSVAQTIVELGIQIEEVSTTGTMKEALNQALGATGAKVVYIEN
jgi:rsbT co-antagonist protein RsbR